MYLFRLVWLLVLVMTVRKRCSIKMRDKLGKSETHLWLEVQPRRYIFSSTIMYIGASLLLLDNLLCSVKEAVS